MTHDLLTGGILLAITIGLIFIGRPNKAGESPRFLRFGPALVLFPPVVMIFGVFGVAEVGGIFEHSVKIANAAIRTKRTLGGKRAGASYRFTPDTLAGFAARAALAVAAQSSQSPAAI